MTTPAFDLTSLLADVDAEKRLAPCGIRRLVLGPGAIDAVGTTLTELLAPRRAGAGERPEVVVLVDPTPIRRRGEDLKDLLQRRLEEDFVVRRVVLRDEHAELHVTDAVVAEAVAGCRGADAVVAVGGGTVSDIAKLAAVATQDESPDPVLVSVQTAASVDGFTDDVSVVLRDGVKRTVPSRWPDAVVADDETIAEAPAVMNRAGFGEMTSMLVAPADWWLAGLVGIDPTVQEAPIRLLELVGADLESWSPGVRTADPAAVAQLTKALDLRGVATGVAGTTAVLSGVEHLVSHMLDQHHTAHHRPMGLHGAQVGVASVISAAAWELLHERLAVTTPSLDESSLDHDRARERVEAAFAGLDADGRIAAECWQDYSAKLTRIAALLPSIEAVLADWSRHEPRLRQLARPSADIAGGLAAAGAPTSFAELDPGVSDDLGRWAVTNCALMRNRFTVVDLLTLLGWWSDPDVAEVLERAARAVGVGRAGASAALTGRA